MDRHAATIAAARDDKAQLSLRESEATQAFHKKWILEKVDSSLNASFYHHCKWIKLSLSASLEKGVAIYCFVIASR